MHSSEAEKLKNLGDTQYKNRDFPAALQLYNEAIKLCATNASYYIERSKILFAVGHYKKALNDGRMGLAIDKKSKNSYECIIKCSMRLGDTIEAERAIKKLNEIDSNNEIGRQYEKRLQKLRFFTETATQCFEKKHFQKAVELIESGLKFAPASSKLELLKAKALAHLGRINDAIDIVESVSSNAEADYVLGLCLYYNGDLNDGLKYFQKALERDPNHNEARKMQLTAINLKELKKYGDDFFVDNIFHEARKMYTKALKIHPLPVQFEGNLLSNRAKCYMKLKNYQECIKDYEAALEINPTQAIEIALQQAKDAFKRLAEEKIIAGDNCYAKGHFSMALLSYNAAIGMCPTEASYYCKKSNCLFANRNFKGALKVSQYAVALDSTFAYAYECIIENCLKLGDVDGAKEAFNQLIEICSNRGDYRMYEEQCEQLKTSFGRATQCFGKDDFRAAIEHLDSALQIATACRKFKLLQAECFIYLDNVEKAKNIVRQCNPFGADVYYVVGLCAYYEGDLLNGLLHFRKAIDLDPNHKNARTKHDKAAALVNEQQNVTCLFNTGDFRKAYETITDALDIDPSNKNFNAKLYFGRAMIHSKMEHIQNAIDDCLCALRKNPKYADMVSLCAQCPDLGIEFNDGYDCIIKCYLGLGEFDGAEQAIKKLKEFRLYKDSCRKYKQQCDTLKSASKKAMQYFKRGIYQKAVDHIDRALEIAFACLKYQLLKAKCLIHLGRVDEAGAIADLYAQRYSSNAEGDYVVGLCAYYSGDLDKGLTYFQKALKLAPNHSEATIMNDELKRLKQKKMIGDHSFEAGRFQEACEMYTEALEINSLNANISSELLFYRAKCHMNMENYRDSITDCEAALEIKRTDEIENALTTAKDAIRSLAEYKKNAGDGHFNAGSFLMASILYSEAIELLPEAAYYCYRSKCQFAIGKYKDALKDCQYAVALDSTFAYGYECIIENCLKLGDVGGAKEAFNQIIEIRSNRGDYREYEERWEQLETSFGWAYHCFEMKNFEAAIHHIENALEIAVACMELKLMKAECLMDLGRFDEANDIIESCILIDGSNADLFSYYEGYTDIGANNSTAQNENDEDHHGEYDEAAHEINGDASKIELTMEEPQKAMGQQAESDYDAVSEESIAGNDSLIVEKCPGDIASYHDKDSLDGDFFNDDKSEYGSEPGSSSDDIANEPHSSPNRVAPKEMQRDLTKEKDLQENDDDDATICKQWMDSAQNQTINMLNIAESPTAQNENGDSSEIEQTMMESGQCQAKGVIDADGEQSLTGYESSTVQLPIEATEKYPENYANHDIDVQQHPKQNKCGTRKITEKRNGKSLPGSQIQGRKRSRRNNVLVRISQPIEQIHQRLE